VDDRIAWITLNRPAKRDAMSPTLNREMIDVLETLEQDADAGVLVLTGAGESWSAGMDLKEYFRETDGNPEICQEKLRRDASTWQWKLLRMYAKPTIAMVNGWCFGGAFSPLVACDLAIEAETAVFGLSEINWGIPPRNLVSKAVADTMGHHKALEYIMEASLRPPTRLPPHDLIFPVKKRLLTKEQALPRSEKTSRSSSSLISLDFIRVVLRTTPFHFRNGAKGLAVA
jgi:enoyl-CoA hydratase/carnithine racemase